MQKNESAALTKQQIVSELTRSTHGDLSAYVPVGVRAATEDPDFFAHLIAWNEIKGQVRDSKVALPVLALATALASASEFLENALAHIAKLDPRNLIRAIRFSKGIGMNGERGHLKRLVVRYLREREARWGWWERAALAHRQSMKELYALNHVKPHPLANEILFQNKYPEGTVFAALKNLPNLSDTEAARVIVEHKLPALTILGAIGKRAQSEPLLLALVGSMTPSQAITNAAMLERLGVKGTAALRAAFEAKLAEVVESKKVTLKTGKAAKAVKDKALAERLDAVQEKQINTLGGIEGDWLILADKSGSMNYAIGIAKEIAAFLARVAKGAVSLVFFDTIPTYFNASGKTLEEIAALTRHVAANGGTSIGCGLRYAMEKGLPFGGIVVVSDGGHNTAPNFSDLYLRIRDKEGMEPPIYFYKVPGDSDVFSHELSNRGIELQKFEIQRADHYSLPNLMQTMRTSRYGLVDEIMATPLLTLGDVFKGDEAA